MKLLIGLLLLSTQAFADGSSVYKNNCVTCHGENMDGKGPAGQYMNPHPRDLLKDPFINGDSPNQIFVTVTHGFNQMPPFDSILSEVDRRAVAEYVSSRRKQK